MIKIGELSTISGVNVKTIRYYEEEGLISPCEVDRWTNYRYYNEKSVERLFQIKYLKSLGFSLKEIKNLSEEVIKKKLKETKLEIDKLKGNLFKLSIIQKEGGEIMMKYFINDEDVVGKWKKLAVVKSKEDFASKKFVDEDIFDFKELFFLPDGEDYWVFSWTKGTLYLKDRELPYEIIDDKLFIGVVDYKTQRVDNYAVFEKVDSKHYVKDEIKIKDNTNIPFIFDEHVIGFWQCVDYVRNFEDFELGKKFWGEDLFLTKYIFENNGTLYVEYSDEDKLYPVNWSKGVVINRRVSTVSEYVIKQIGDETIMFVEWKSGDYVFGGEVNGFYVFKKVK